jgi:chromosome segregation protein
MSVARLRELRMVGFKSFAERTVVQLGPGISAVVGPNGSGKSNLADALRWALGEQGRALRSRRAEDLIFAGSANRRAVGMADVSLVIDNADRLLAVEFEEVELSRRLFRSGENEYLLNRQRVRLRDLVDLLDDANIADNAFLFIGQGMVDQALALRPEERRPLFEEAAGIRKHQRRRTRAEAELAEAGTNLERVRDLLGELRPQARRLAAQAEQQEARAAAGAELATALVDAARARLGAAEVESARQAAAVLASRRDADAALVALRDAEEAAAALTHGLAARADDEQGLRGRLDAARAEVQRIELERVRGSADAEAVRRERARIAEDRASANVRAEEARQRMAAVLPDPDPSAEEALADGERRLAEATRDAEDLRRAGRAATERAAATLVARRRLADDAERTARRAEESERRERGQSAEAAAAGRASAAATERAETAAATRAEAHAAESAAEAEAGAARTAAGEAEATAATAREVVARLRAEVEGLAARRTTLDEQLDRGIDAELLRSARARGGRRFSDGLEVEPELRLAVEAALGEVLGGLLLDAAEVPSLAEAAAVLVLRDARHGPARDEGSGRAQERAVSRLEDAVAHAGGGRLDAALRRDPEGHAARLLERCAWLPDLTAALAVRDRLLPGWRLVTRDGVVVDDLGVLRPAPTVSLLERRASREDVSRRLARAREALADAAAQAEAAEAVSRAAEARVAAGRVALDAARRERRVADEADRAAATTAQNAARERAWLMARLERAAAEAAAARQEAAERAAELAAFDAAAGRPEDRAAGRGSTGGAELAALDARIASLREQRDAAALAARDARALRERALEERRRAEVGLGLAEARVAELDREEVALGGREADIAAREERLSTEAATAQALLRQESAAFEASMAAARVEREQLLAAESGASAARERLRLAELRSRAAEVGQMEARLQADAAREGLLVELATIGPDGLAILLAQSGQAPPAEPPGSDELPDLLESAVEAALAAWRDGGVDGPASRGQAAEGEALGDHASREPPFGDAPSRARIAALRRRFNDVGASNPYAAQELAEVRLRLDSLEAQREDLEKAIRDTRELMARLDQLMTEQFRTTFAALEGAFARRFQQLFDGGDAQLSLTDPEDLAATGVEITARPPGKRRQPLAMLSGGERALTAVALLMAMLEVRPVPFCVLDEVDAALDEANIGRFSSALRSLAEDIQFVVITHNRGTIEAADALYGVTVGDDAVSRVISMRLAELPSDDAAVAAAAG